MVIDKIEINSSFTPWEVACELINAEYETENYFNEKDLLAARLIANYEQKTGITIHNKIVPLVNSKNYSQAIKILEEGLKENPNSIEIKNDLNRLKKFAY